MCVYWRAVWRGTGGDAWQYNQSVIHSRFFFKISPLLYGNERRITHTHIHNFHLTFFRDRNKMCQCHLHLVLEL